MKSGYLILGVVLISVMSVLSLSLLSVPQSPTLDDSLNYYSEVCYATTGDFEGRETPAHSGIVEQVQCGHNLLYDNGKNLTKLSIGNGLASGAFNNISLCNGSAGCATPTVGMSETYNEITECGLHNQGGTYSSYGIGNWSVSNTFTSSCSSLITNSSRIQNQTGSSFAGSLFTKVTLESSDQLTINWTMGVV